MNSSTKPQPTFRHQPFSAGKHGFMIGVHILDNPYSKEPSHTQWEKGWRVARREWENKRGFQRKARPAAKPAPRNPLLHTAFNIPASSRFTVNR